MIYRTLGKSSISVSVIGFGCAGLGNDYPPGTPGVYGQDAEDLLQYAVDNGITVFDTDPGYGQSESILRQFFMFNGPDCHVFTKGLKGTDDVKEVFPLFSYGVGGPNGLSVYRLSEAIYAYDFVQVPFNPLQISRPRPGVGFIGRSPLLRGKLASMAEDALRYSFFNGPHCTLVGFKSKQEIDFALNCLEKGPITWDQMTDLRKS